MEHIFEFEFLAPLLIVVVEIFVVVIVVVEIVVVGSLELSSFSVNEDGFRGFSFGDGAGVISRFVYYIPHNL